MKLHLQIHIDGRWRDAVEIVMPEPNKGRMGPIELGYIQAYALEYLGQQGLAACSLTKPVELIQNWQAPSWYALLDDIMPAGASRRYWVARLGLAHTSEFEQDLELLRHGAIAPVGNIRVKEALPDKSADDGNTVFTISDVVERHVDFLEYAQEMGAASGGATGAGGEAPKFLLRCNQQQQVWVDTWQDDNGKLDTHYLVKFPRGKRSAIDCDILRAEYHYYHELCALGMNTINTDAMRLEEGSQFPSLWLPRFDVVEQQGQLQRYGLESIYSVLNKAPGTLLNHLDVLAQLIPIMKRVNGASFDTSVFVLEWLKRDLCNVVFGNSDNHGRNTALLKTPSGVALAPIYDFAPMKADPEGITRSIKWPQPLERGGNFNWLAIIDALQAYAEPPMLFAGLKQLAENIVGVQQRLQSRGVPNSILTMPVLGFEFTDQRLREWGLV